MDSSVTPILVVLAQDHGLEQVWPQLADLVPAQLHPARTLTEELPESAICGAIIVTSVDEEWLDGAVLGLLKRGIDNVVAVGCAGDQPLTIRARKLGVQDYYVLPRDLPALEDWARAARERWGAQESARQLLAFERARHSFSELIGESPEFTAALSAAATLIPQHKGTVMLTGESGTGKESIAKVIHYNGARGLHPFVVLNCSALPGALLESELFGYVAGAFAGAVGDKPGLLEIADGGTLFLDEVVDLPWDLQLKLLRAMEDGEFRRLGTRQSMRMDVRIMAATAADPRAAVELGKFRQDLHYRLSVVPIRLPPLRERGRDVLQLAEYFLAVLSEDFHLSRPAIGPAVEEALLTYPWPGNIRELRNAIERGLLLGEGALELVDLFQSKSVVTHTIPFPAPMVAIERAAAQAMVARYNGNKKAAAAALRISRTRLYRLLKEPKYGTPRE